MPSNPPVGATSAGNMPTTPHTTAVSQSTQEAIQGLQVQPRDLADAIELDPSSLDPNFTYRWVYKAPKKVARARQKGYVIVNPKEDEILNALGDPIDPASDNTYTAGDVVLMKIRKLDHKTRRKMSEKKTQQRLGRGKRNFKKLAEEKQAESGYDVELISDKEPKGHKD